MNAKLSLVLMLWVASVVRGSIHHSPEAAVDYLWKTIQGINSRLAEIDVKLGEQQKRMSLLEDKVNGQQQANQIRGLTFGFDFLNATTYEQSVTLSGQRKDLDATRGQLENLRQAVSPILEEYAKQPKKEADEERLKNGIKN